MATPNEIIADVNTLNIGQAILHPLPERDEDTDVNEYEYAQNWLTVYVPYNVHQKEKLYSKEEVLRVARAVKSESEKEEYLQAFENTMNKYRQYSYKVPESVISEDATSEAVTEYNNYNSPDNYDVSRNMEKVLQAHGSYRFSSADNEGLGILGLFIGWLGLILIVFLRTNLRTTIISAIVGFAIVLGSVFVSEISHYEARQGILQFFYFASWGLAAMIAFSARNTTHFNLIRKVALSLVVVFMPFFFVMLFGDHSKSGTFASGYFGILLTYVGWFLLFNKRMMTLISQPKQD